MLVAVRLFAIILPSQKSTKLDFKSKLRYKRNEREVICSCLFNKKVYANFNETTVYKRGPGIFNVLSQVSEITFRLQSPGYIQYYFSFTSPQRSDHLSHFSTLFSNKFYFMDHKNSLPCMNLNTTPPTLSLSHSLPQLFKYSLQDVPS